VGLTPSRLDAAAEKVKKGGILGICVAILVPGVRGAAVVASGLVDLPLSTFLSGLAIGSILFISLHFFLGYLGGSALSIIGRVLPLPSFIIVVLVLLVIIYALWVVASRQQKAAHAELDEAQKAASIEVWHEGICPVCLALYTANQLRTYTADRLVG
ncbi:MAG TPA: VTT domain-containing protein, partial [Ktedonobacteraceae bacterium]|nr:VTT domain-containing protein [Ktedonobacteraceae bacterium]